MVTALAILLSTLRRYTTGPLATAGDWAREWRVQIGDDALRLIAPESEVGFFQPPLDPETRRSPSGVSDIDLTFTRAMHAAKPVDDGTAEEALFALLSGAWSLTVINGGRHAPMPDNGIALR